MFGKKKVVLEKKENTMLELSRAEILDRFRKSLAEGNILLGVGAHGMHGESAEAGGATSSSIYNSGRFRMAGRGSLAGLLSYGDANQIVVEMGAEVLPVVKDTPVLAGVCGTDPFRVMKKYLAELKDQGFNGVQNFPTVGLIDGVFRKNLEETGMGYGLEVDMIAEAHKLDMLTCPYVFDEEQAAAMTKAGADIIVAHMGLTTGGTIGAETARTLDDCVEIITGIVKVVKDINPDALVICHGGPISERRTRRTSSSTCPASTASSAPPRSSAWLPSAASRPRPRPSRPSRSNSSRLQVPPRLARRAPVAICVAAGALFSCWVRSFLRTAVLLALY